MLFGFLATGFLLGIQHSLEPDHVAAVWTMVSKNRSLGRSALMGAVWGVGHTITISMVGFAVLLLKISIPEFVSRIFEFCIGAILVYLGFVLLKHVFIDKVHIHRHRHDGIEHTHMHLHRAGPMHDHLHKPLLIGMVHGLAGSAGIMLLILASMQSVIQGLLFALMFGLGSVLGMAATGTLMGLPFIFASSQTNLNRLFMTIIACASIVLGLMVLRNNWIF